MTDAMRYLLTIVLAVFLAFPAGAQAYSELFAGEEASSLRHTADSVSTLGTEEALSEFVSHRLSSFGIELFEGNDDTSFGIRRENGDTATFRNVIAWIPGYDKQIRGRYVVIGTRLASGNGSGLALLLRLAEKLNTNRVLLRRSVIVAAFGGAMESNAGSWYFLNRSFPEVDKIDAFECLDLFDNPGRGLYAYTASNADLNQTLHSIAETLQPARPVLTTVEPAVADHRSFYAKEIPSVFFTTAEPGKIYRPGTDPLEYEEMERQCEYLYNFTLALCNGNAPSFHGSSSDAKVPLVAFGDCDVKPRFLGASDPAVFLGRWVYTYLRYPDYALENGIKGRVQVSLVIDEKGKVGNVRVEKGVHPSLDAEAVRVIEASPDWKPGMVDGKPVRTRLSLYVDFKLRKAKKQ